MPNKILIPLQSFVSCFLEPPVDRQEAVGATVGLAGATLQYVPKAPLSAVPY